MENYHLTLPEGYEVGKVIDAKDKKTSLLLTLCSFLLTILALVPILMNLEGGLSQILDSLDESPVGHMVAWLVFFVAFILYIILHELTHGAAYKALTHQKLTFGLTLTVAFCGVPHIYTSRKTALISTSAPLVVFSVILIPILVVLHSVNQLYYLLTGLLFAVHFGGCIGDMYVIALFLFRFKDPRSLMNDTGPKQTFYVPIQEKI